MVVNAVNGINLVIAVVDHELPGRKPETELSTSVDSKAFNVFGCWEAVQFIYAVEVLSLQVDGDRIKAVASAQGCNFFASGSFGSSSSTPPQSVSS